MGKGSSKDASLGKIFHELVLLELENPGHQVRAVLRCLSRSETSVDFWPLGVAGHGKEEVRLVHISNDGHAILKLGVEPSGTALEGAGKDDSTRCIFMLIVVE